MINTIFMGFHELKICGGEEEEFFKEIFIRRKN